MGKQIGPEDAARFAAAFDADPKNLLVLNAVTKNDVHTVALSRDVVNRTDHTYSHLIETPEATSQGGTGRCWIFAALNTFRLVAMEKMGLKQFELSQAYPMFWDKLEKANFFLENIIETCDETLDGRLVTWLLSDPLPDAGQWDMLVNLIEKYGVVPKSVMPETNSSYNSRSMNTLLIYKLRECAWALREMHGRGAEVEEMRRAKGEMLEVFYRMLCIHLGKPPSRFLWEWRDSGGEFHRYGEITPSEFYREYVGIDLNDMVCLINAPTRDKPYGKLYTVQYLGNVAGGHIVRYINIEIETLKKAAMDSVVDGRAVWFGCDVGKMNEGELGLLNHAVYDYGLVYGADFELDKAGRLDYGHSRMTHAMVFTGVDIDDAGNPVKWRVENSGGTRNGDKGYLAMSDRWFDEYLYEIVVHRKYVSPELLKIRDTEPIVLPPWDPMGALARSTI